RRRRHPGDPADRPDPPLPRRGRQLAGVQLAHRRDPGAPLGRGPSAGRPPGAGHCSRGRAAPRPGGERMNRPLRHVWLVIGVLFVLLFTSTTYFQVVAQERLNAHGQNDRTLYNEYGRHRGPIVVDGEAIASSQESGDTYGYLRSYDPGGMYAPVTGYYSVVYGFTGIERSLNETLSGDADALFYHRLSAILSGRQGQGASVELTLDAGAQEAAWEALDGRRGSVVALDRETGAVLAMVSARIFAPNGPVPLDTAAVCRACLELNGDPARRLTIRAIGGDFCPPGSAFKFVVAAAALESGEYTAE